MADSIREQIVELIRERFETILTANGYETDLGANVFIWRDTNAAPPAASELPLLNFRDVREETEPKVSGRTDHHHTLFGEAEIVAGTTSAGGNTDAAKQVRKCISDVLEAIRSDTRWTDADGSMLAFQTWPMDNEMVVDQSGRTIGGAKVRFKVEYRTQRWNPYEQ
jgi:hypothetical protein